MNDIPAPRRRFGCFHALLFMLIAVALTVVALFFVYQGYLAPRPLKPVQLNAGEEKALQVKLAQLDIAASPPDQPAPVPETEKDGALAPEAYSEEGVDRTIRFTEKELNALLANNTDLADKLAIDLSKDLISAKLLIPLDEDFPVLGGKTLRVKAGVAFRYEDGRPVVMLRGITVMGVPLPNAWLGNLKNIDLIKESGGDPRFWKGFADGVEHLSVEEGLITIKLKK